MTSTENLAHCLHDMAELPTLLELPAFADLTPIPRWQPSWPLYGEMAKETNAN